MQWTIASKNHLAKEELSVCLRRESYLSRRCLPSVVPTNTATFLAIRTNLKSITQPSYLYTAAQGYTANMRCEEPVSERSRENLLTVLSSLLSLWPTFAE